MSPKPATDIRSYSPFRTPDWRWQAALDHVHQQTRPRKWEDQGRVQVRRFLLDLNRAGTEAKRNRVARTWPDLFGAHAIFTGDPIRRDELEARLLCEPVEGIAEKMNIPAGVVVAFAGTFFDVLHCRQALDWLLEHAIRAHSFARPPTEAECWRYMALAGGPFILELLIADHLGRPELQHPDRHELAERARFLVREHAAYVQTGNPADPEFVAEFRRRYREKCQRNHEKPDPKVLLQLKILSMAASSSRRRRVKVDLLQLDRQTSAWLDQSESRSKSPRKPKASHSGRRRKPKQEVSQNDRGEKIAELCPVVQQ
ncbi:MAG: hypothetical protein ABSB74_03820 [Tepidisphaeraceae bacterium]